MGHSARAFQGGGGFTIAKAFTMTLAKRRNGPPSKDVDVGVTVGENPRQSLATSPRGNPVAYCGFGFSIPCFMFDKSPLIQRHSKR